MKKLGIGILGCGFISDIYLKNLQTVFENTFVVAVCDMDMQRAKEKAKQYGVPKALTFDEMIADPEVALILNITTPPVHYQLSLKALQAHKHVFSEKPLALTYAQCVHLMEEATKNGVLLGSAPDTFLGSTYQTAREIVDSGVLGDITSAYSFDVCHGHEGWHPAPAFFYEEGAGPMYDRGPYNMSTLVALLGAVDTVAGMTGKAFEERIIGCGENKGQTVPVKVPTHVNGMLHFASGALGMVSASFDVWDSKLPFAELHGTKGSLLLPIPIDFDGDIFMKIGDAENFTKMPVEGAYTVNSRGLGLSDMVYCILNGGAYRCNASLATHCVEIMEALHVSSDASTFVKLKSTCERPSMMQKGLAFGQVSK